MSFNLSSFKVRSLTALVFGSCMIFGLIWNQWSFLILFSIIHFGCWFEYQKLIGNIDPAYAKIHPLHRYGIMFIGWGLMLWVCTGFEYETMSIPLVGWSFFWVGTISFILSELLLAKNLNPKLWAHSIFGILYISLSWACMIKLYGNLDGSIVDSERWTTPALLIGSIWINDTSAYLIGSLFGKTPLSPVSPKKTWEGTIGGIILSVLLVVCVGHYCLGFAIKPLLIISLTASIVGTFGDLLESKLKRMANVKDSGNLLPGHGGFLDRFDSLLLSTTVVFILCYFFC